MKKHHRHVIDLIEAHGIENVVEIGVWAAALSLNVLENCSNIKSYIGIDPYRKWKTGYNDSKNRQTQSQFQSVYSIAKAIYDKYDQATLLRMTRDEAVACVGEVDMVFIDANHDYGYVKNDIINWSFKVRKGGLVSGHDYATKFPGVVKAVNEYCSRRSVVLSKGKGQVWYFVQN